MADPPQLEDRRNVLIPGLLGILFYRTVKEADPRIAVSGKSAFDKVLKSPDGSNGRIGSDLISRERQSLVVLV